MPKPNENIDRMIKRGVVRVFFEVYKDLHFDLDEPTQLKKVVTDVLSDAGWTMGLVEMPGLRTTEHIIAVMVEDRKDKDKHQCFEGKDLDTLLCGTLEG